MVFEKVESVDSISMSPQEEWKMQKKPASLFFEISYASSIQSYRVLGFEGWKAVAGPQVSPSLDQSFFSFPGFFPHLPN